MSLEAAAAGLPLLSSQLHGVEEFLVEGVNGWCIERDANVITAKLREIADEQGAFLVVAHPFRHFFDPVTAKREGKKPFDLYPEQAAHLPVFQLVHGIEVLNGCNTPRENYFALQVAKIMGKPGTGGSDAHSTQGIGYFTAVFDETIETTEQMVSQMHLGRFHPGRGLPDGNLNNYWETAEPVPFYE